MHRDRGAALCRRKLLVAALGTMLPADLDPLDKARTTARTLAEQTAVRLDLSTCYPAQGATAEGSVEFTPLDAAGAGVLRQASAMGTGLRIRVLRGNQEGSPSLWELDLPLPAPGKVATFRLPTAGLAPGRYRLTTDLTLSPAPSGKEPIIVPFSRNKLGSIPELPLVVRVPGHVPVGTGGNKVPDSARLLTHAEQIGDPFRQNFHTDDPADCQARSVWDLQQFAGRIFAGCGDWNNNRGPITLWSCDAASGKDGRSEVVVREESVEQFRVLGDSLYLPGIDALAADTKTVGSLYRRSRNGDWERYESVPDALHVFDVARAGGRLYVTAGGQRGGVLFVSDDGGKTWNTAAENLAAYRFWGLAPLPDGSLLIVPASAKQGAFRYRPAPKGARGELKPVFCDLFPGLRAHPRQTTLRLEPFINGVVYTVRPLAPDLLRQKGQPRPLYYLTGIGPEVEVRVIAPFADRVVTDIVVREGRCHLLTATPASTRPGDRFIAEIFDSPDLVRWNRRARVSLPAFPNSLEASKDSYLVGLANRSRTSADTASGSLWRLRP
ncbi:MAG: exo-alpha-sialidase [Cytophagales bacterium]|nr:exo-alpha-sialidase [Armatimonadota bacterium]